MIAIKEQNHNAATDEKTKVEDAQREEAARRLEQGVEWQPKLFRKVRGGPGGPEEGEEDLDWVLNAEMFIFKLVFLESYTMLTLLVTALRLTSNLSKYSPLHQSSEINLLHHRASVLVHLTFSNLSLNPQLTTISSILAKQRLRLHMK